MTKFADNLWTNLTTQHGQPLAEANEPRARRRPGRLVAAGAAVVALGVAGAIAGPSLFHSAPQAQAFEVVKNSDGTVTLTIKDVAAVDPANAELRRLGVRAKAVPTKPERECPMPHENPPSAGSDNSRARPGVSSTNVRDGSLIVSPVS